MSINVTNYTISLAQKTGSTALIMASQNGHTRIVEMLLEAGTEDNTAQKKNADPNILSSKVMTMAMILLVML